VTKYSDTDYTSLRLQIHRDLAYPAPKSDGVQHNLYVGGDKPSTAYSANLSVTDDGVTYHVYTTAALSTMKLGYVIRWRVINNWGEHGQWVTPPANWTSHMPPASAGMPFWRSWISGQNGHVSDSFNYTHNSLADWYAHMAPYPENWRYSVWYAAEMAVRHVWLSNPTDGMVADELDTVTISQQTLTESRMLLRPRPPGNYAPTFNFSKTIHITLKPSGTCTTPSMQEATINFNTVMTADIPWQGADTGERTFDLIFRKCPRISIGYHLHANGKWIAGEGYGVVGLSDSIPHADPNIGNPRGFGIRLFHNGGQSGFGEVKLSQDASSSYKHVYLLTYPGAGAENITSGPDAGVKHTIPMRAHIYRTSPASHPIGPGPFSAALVFVISYP